MEDSCTQDNAATQQAEALRFRKQSKKIGRKLSRRLSLIAKVPNIFNVKFTGSESSAALQKSVPLAAATANSDALVHEITVIAPDKTQRLNWINQTDFNSCITLNGVDYAIEFDNNTASDMNSIGQNIIHSPINITNSNERQVTGSSDQTIKQLLAGLVFEFSLEQPGYYLGGSLAEIDENCIIDFVVGDIVIIKENQFHSDLKHENDRRYCLTEKFVYDENAYITCLKSAKELYGEPLRRMEIFSSEEYNLIFENLMIIADECHQIITELKLIMENWDPVIAQIGSLFSTNFWDRYNDYQDVHHHGKELLREKSALDEDFVAFCVQREGSAKNSLRHIIDLPVQRLAQYETYIQSLLDDTRPEHGRGAEYHDLCMANSAVKQTIKRAHEQSDLERIQDVFPNDFLRLYDKEALTMKMKGLIRKRGGTGTAALRRALSSKSLRSESPSSTPDKIRNESPRKFIMETPVQFVNGVHCQERHLFLFNDLLLVAKAKSGSNFKLKDKVRISEIWLNESPAVIDEVAEISKSTDTSFVIGWPTTNYVAVFSTQATRNLWWSKLTDESQEEIRKEPPTTNIQVFYQDLNTGIEYCKTFAIGPDESARDCVKIALNHLEMRDVDPSQYQLWAKTPREEPPYPLFGHEKPYSVKLSCLRDGLSAEEGFDLDHCNNVHDPLARCHFILRSVKAQENDTNKKTPKKSSSRMKIGQVFKKTPTKENGGNLFGVPLGRICDGENLPKPVMGMLHQMFTKGPFTQGIFRKSANARLVRELREKMDVCEDVCLENVPVLVTAALFKDMLRSLPDPLLCTNLFPKWRSALDCPNLRTKLFKIKMIIDQLPKPNYHLLCHFLCVLYHISRRSAHNLMSAANLGVCVGPSLLWSDSPAMCPTEDLRTVPALVEILITHCELLCGPHVPNLLGDPRDSGTEESDSMRRDDSSIDSLEVSPPPRKDQISLSRDSGLTLSDSQLYTPDEEESGSTSSSGYDPAFDQAHHPAACNKTAAVAAMPGEYVRVYPGWEERKNANFQRQAWFRQRSKRLTAAASKEAVRRSASEESVLDGVPPPTPPRRTKPAANGCNGRVSLPLPPSQQQLQQDQQYRKMTAANYYNVVMVGANNNNNNNSSISSSTSSSNKSEVVVESLHPNSFSTELTIKPVVATAVAVPPVQAIASYNKEEPLTVPVRRVSEAVDCSRRYHRRPDDGFCVGGEKEDDSSTVSDEDCTPHVSRSNSRGNEVAADSPKLRQHHHTSSAAAASSSPPSNVASAPATAASTTSNTTTAGTGTTPPTHHADGTIRLRGRLKRKEEKTAVAVARSRSLPPPPPYRPPPPANRRAPITSYYLGECSQAQQQRFVVTRTYADEESYV